MRSSSQELCLCAVPAGGNAYGQLGDNTTTDRTTPTSVIVTGTFTQVTAGRYGDGKVHTCVLRSDGAVLCFGECKGVMWGWMVQCAELAGVTWG